MNDLEKYFRQNDKRLIHKWAHYFDVYDRHFSKYRNKEIVVLEIGVSQGGSLQMWRNYFGTDAQIFMALMSTQSAKNWRKKISKYS